MVEALPPALAQRIERISRKKVAKAVRPPGGYTPALRFVITFSDGSSAFAKAGTTPLMGEWLRNEAGFYTAADPAPFLPRLLGWDDDAEQPLLLTESLAEARWPPPWLLGDAGRVLDTVDRIAEARPPDRLPRLTGDSEYLRGWAEVAADPRPFLSLGFGSEKWLQRALPALVDAEATVDITGDQLIHCDIRSDNLCFEPGRVVVVDWNHACIGNGLFDKAFLLPSLHFEGGPLPEDACPEAAPMAAGVAGFFAARAGLPNIPDAPFVRRVQREQLSTALPWAVRVLRLPSLDGPAATA